MKPPRYAGVEQAAELARLHAGAFEAPWSAQAIAELMRGLGVMTFEAEVGFVMVRVLAEEAEIMTLAVDPAARRRGVGRALVQTAVAAAEAGGSPAVFLEVAHDNAAALALYEAEGFRRVGLRRGYYARPGGPAADAVVMRRALNSPEG